MAPITRFYKRRPGLSLDEKKVIRKGFPHVTTIILKPGGRLNDHFHHSYNTHYIVQGSMEMGKTKYENSDIDWLRPQKYFAEHYVNMEALCYYKAVAGEAGCVFVEGHEELSPTTAKRFVLWGTLVEVAEGKKYDFFTTEESSEGTSDDGGEGSSKGNSKKEQGH